MHPRYEHDPPPNLHPNYVGSGLSLKASPSSRSSPLCPPLLLAHAPLRGVVPSRAGPGPGWDEGAALSTPMTSPHVPQAH